MINHIISKLDKQYIYLYTYLSIRVLRIWFKYFDFCITVRPPLTSSWPGQSSLCRVHLLSSMIAALSMIIIVNIYLI